jgi:hypothetical protein
MAFFPVVFLLMCVGPPTKIIVIFLEATQRTANESVAATGV